MAQKRCFTPKIVESDAFLEMPLSTQCLYFHLNFSADDDGFVNNPKKIMRAIGCSEDDLKLLIAKAFILVFESGIIVIKHYRMHNTLQNDRYHPTDYQEEFSMLKIKENKAYSLMETKCFQNVSNLETEHNITKHNITKHSSRYLEAGYSEDDVSLTNKIIESLSLKELTEEIYETIMSIVQKENIIKKQEYAYTTAKEKGWLR